MDDQIGLAVAGIGDVDGDMVPDMAVGNIHIGGMISSYSSAATHIALAARI